MPARKPEPSSIAHPAARRAVAGRASAPATMPEPPLTDAEEAEIQRQIAADPDDFELPEGATLTPFAEAHPDLAASIRRGRGRPPTGKARTPVTLRLDADVLAKFRATGPGWQTRINAALRAATVPAKRTS